MKHNKHSKTPGSEAGKLVTELHEQGKTISRYAERKGARQRQITKGTFLFHHSLFCIHH